jgi:hypothetical protein
VVPVGCAAGIDRDAGRALGIQVARDDFEARHRGDRRQGFAAESQRRDRAEIVSAGDLAGGMTRKRQREFVDRNPRAVVAHAREAHAAGFDVHFHALRTGIETVLHQFLDDGGGSFDDFARGDLIDEVVVENADGHGDLLRPRSLLGVRPHFAYLRSSTCAPPAARRLAARRVPSGAFT